MAVLQLLEEFIALFQKRASIAAPVNVPWSALVQKSRLVQNCSLYYLTLLFWMWWSRKLLQGFLHHVVSSVILLSLQSGQLSAGVGIEQRRGQYWPPCCSNLWPLRKYSTELEFGPLDTDGWWYMLTGGRRTTPPSHLSLRCSCILLKQMGWEDPQEQNSSYSQASMRRQKTWAWRWWESLRACLFACFFGSSAATSCPVQAGPFCLKICHSEEAFYYLTGKHICLESLLPGRSHYPLRGLLPVSCWHYGLFVMVQVGFVWETCFFQHLLSEMSTLLPSFFLSLPEPYRKKRASGIP